MWIPWVMAYWEGEHLWKLSHTVIILMKIENDWWNHLYILIQHLDSMNLINTCLMGSRTNTIVSTFQAFLMLFLWAHFYLTRIWKQHALPTSYIFAIYKPINVISPLTSLCVLEWELSSYLKFKYCPGLASNMSNFEDEIQRWFLLFGFVVTNIRNRLCK